MEIKQLFCEQVVTVQKILIEKVAESERKGSLSSQERRNINEALISIDKVLNCTFLQPHDRILLEKTYRYGHDYVHNNLNFFAGFYYAYSKISKGDINNQQAALIQVNADTSTMLTTILGCNRHLCGIGGSIDDYFVERLHRVLWAIEFVYKKKLSDIYLPSMYVLTNLAQTLTEYVFSGDSQYMTKEMELLVQINKWILSFKNENSVKEILNQNLQLSLFLVVQQRRMNNVLGINNEITQPVITEVPNVKTENKLRILTSLYYLDNDLFVRMFESELSQISNDIYNSRNGLNNFLFLQCLSFYCILKNNISSVDLDLNPITKKNVDVENNLDRIFKDYASSQKEVISEGEMNLLLGYKDEFLRKKVAETILGVDRAILNRESSKPHGVFEIADMEVPIRLNNQRFFLCIPFKSGIEIKGPSVPESIAYQIFRPFIHFDNAIVVFVTAKKCSQNLFNYIKRMQDKLGWAIAVIENEELAKLLKANHQLV